MTSIQQIENNRAVATALIQTLDWIEEIIGDVENGENPGEALAILKTLVTDQMVEAAEAGGMVKEIRIIQGGCSRMCQVFPICQNGPLSGGKN